MPPNLGLEAFLNHIDQEKLHPLLIQKFGHPEQRCIPVDRHFIGLEDFYIVVIAAHGVAATSRQYFTTWTGLDKGGYIRIKFWSAIMETLYNFGIDFSGSRNIAYQVL